MKLPAVALMLAIHGVPALAQPAPLDEIYREAVSARHAGNSERAAVLLRQVTAAQPKNADAHLQLGISLLDLGQADQAEAAFRRTLEIAPGYVDARLGLARVEQRRGNRSAVLAQLDLVEPSHPEAIALRTQIQGMQTPTRWGIDADGAYTFLSEGLEDWKDVALRVTHQASSATAVSAAIEVSRRFGFTDTYGELRAAHRFARNAGSAYILAGATPGAQVRPQWQFGLGGEVRLRGGPAATLLTLDARQARYSIGDIQTLNPGIDQYLARGRAWLGVRWINIFDENGRHHSGWLARGDVLATDRLRLFAGAANAPDTSEGRVIDTFSLFGGLSWDVDDRVTLRASLAHDDRESGSDRLQLGLGAGWRF